MNQHIKISVGQKWTHPIWGDKVFVISRIDDEWAYYIDFNTEIGFCKLSAGLISHKWVCINESSNDLINQE